jgi:hypothetical protein
MLISFFFLLIFSSFTFSYFPPDKELQEKKEQVRHISVLSVKLQQKYAH